MGQKYRSKDQTIRNNLKQYGFENFYIDILVADFSTKYFRSSFKFDAIITDPPYGIREKAKKIGNKSLSKSPTASLNDSTQDLETNNEPINTIKQLRNDEEAPTFHSPQKIKYFLGEIYNDLLTFALENLTPNGRLVYWLPIYLELDRSKLR